MLLVRDALAVEIPRILDLFKEAHAKSRFTRYQMDLDEARKLLMSCIMHRIVKGPGGSCLYVAEQAGAIVGFLNGITERAYHVGVPLMANDIYLYANPPQGVGLVGVAAGLIDAYTAWWEGNHRVVLGNLSYTDFIQSDPRLEALYERKGYRRRGAIFGKER